MSEIYKVISVSCDTIIVEADDFKADKDKVVFVKNNKNIAWFKSDNIVGFIMEQEHE